MVGKSGGAEEGSAAAAAVRRWVEAGGGRLVMDGGLATELEANGADLNDPLWSAKCLLSSPHLIRKATIQGFESKGFSKEQSENLLTKSVEIAREAREMFLKEHSDQSTPMQHPILVAASIGSYGAYLADGSEYSGDYGEAGTLEFLKDFHRRRLQVLAEAGPYLIAFETIPNKLEAQAYAELLEECNITIPAWFSFNSKDGINVVSGDSLIECATIANACAKVGAVGINCTPPRFIHGLILSIRKVTDKPILIYPNSGERYDAEKKVWVRSINWLDQSLPINTEHAMQVHRSGSIMQHTTAPAATTTTTYCDDDKKKKKIKKRQGSRTPASASMGRPSVEAVAMAGAADWPWPGECDDDGGGGTRAPEHLHAFEAFLEEVVPVDMLMASRREEEARVRRGGKQRSYDDDVKEKLKLWAKAVVKNTMENVNHRS